METTIWLLLGVALAVVFSRIGDSMGPRISVLYAIGLLVAAVIYVGFASYPAEGRPWLYVELGGVALYGGAAWLGVRHSGWWLAIGWAARR